MCQMLIAVRETWEAKDGRSTNWQNNRWTTFHKLWWGQVWSFSNEGRKKKLKRYGALFTCFSSKTDHIECTCSLETDSLIQTLCRFVLRRRNIRVLRSDDGTNFVGAQKELEKACNEMDHQKIEFFFQNIGADYINWHRKPPASRHMAFVWERQIRSTCTILMYLLHTHGRSLNDESLRTLLAETEAIANFRSSTVYTPREVQSKQPICTRNILTMKSKVVLPPPSHFVKADEYSIKRWTRIQHIANEFWVRWRKEFLWLLQPRHKWNEKHRNF